MPEPICPECNSQGLKPRTTDGTVTVLGKGLYCASHGKRANADFLNTYRLSERCRRYGMTTTQYRDLINSLSDGLCPICRRNKATDIEHDHATGFVRGITCNPCNVVIAHFHDDVSAAQRLVGYLESPPAFGVIGKVKPTVLRTYRPKPTRTRAIPFGAKKKGK